MTRAADDFAAIRARMQELSGEIAPVAYVEMPVINFADVQFVDTASWGAVTWTAKKSYRDE